MASALIHRASGWIALLCVVAGLFAMPAFAQPRDGAPAYARFQSQPGVAPADWRAFRDGAQGRTSSRSLGAEALIARDGARWKTLRTRWLSPLGAWVLGGSAALIAVFYLLAGPVRLHQPRTGRRIERWSRWDRAIHWYTALLFLVLALTGLSLLYAKWFLMPLLPPGLWGAWMNLAKLAHNYLGPLFALGVFAMILKWLHHNLPRRVDVEWFLKGGGLIGNAHPHAGYLNGGEKLFFWLVVAFGLVIVASGLVLDFPNFGQSRETMQLFTLVHAAASIVLTAIALGHIYIGSIGTEGAYEGMRTGYVDETWARQHHDLWYESVKDRDRPRS